jgi:hypothetical protein
MRFKTNVRPIAYLCVSLTHVRATDLATWWKRDYAGAFVVDTVQYIDQNTLRHPLYPSAHVHRSTGLCVHFRYPDPN